MMKLGISSRKRQMRQQQRQWISLQAMYRLRLEANKHSRWKKIRLAPLQEAYWIILLGIIFMLAGGAFVLLTMELFSA